MMRTILGAMLVALMVVACEGCGAAVVRDANTYRQELRWLGAAGEQLATTQLELAGEAARGGALTRCQRIAEPALVVRRAAPYHAAMALFLAGLGDDPGDPPEIAASDSWCADIQGAAGRVGASTVAGGAP